MARARFRSKQKQIIFFREVLEHSGYSPEKLARRCKVVVRTLNDWRRGKYLSNYEMVTTLSNEFKVPLDGVRELEQYWYVKKGASKGAKARFEKYGHLGTPEGRIKGGKVSQQRRREDPEKYRALGCNVRKEFALPPHSEKLAELVGIILGDGTISDYQVKIFLDRIRDEEYAVFVADLMEEILGERPSAMIPKAENVIVLTVSGVNLVEVFEQLGLQRGDKVLHQASFPQWIQDDLIYRMACTRGLFDTDGGLYFHQKAVKKYLGWCFASHSKPLLDGVMDTLREMRFNVKKVGEHKLYMYGLKDIFRYLDFIGSHNPKNAARLGVRLGWNLERCASGRNGVAGNDVCQKWHRGFESLPLREDFLKKR